MAEMAKWPFCLEWDQYMTTFWNWHPFFAQNKPVTSLTKILIKAPSMS